MGQRKNSACLGRRGAVSVCFELKHDKGDDAFLQWGVDEKLDVEPNLQYKKGSTIEGQG